MTMVIPDFGTFYLPGPTEVRRATLEAMAKPMIPHRSQEFRDMYARIQERLKIVFATRRPVLIATSSATGLMEAAIRNGPPGRVLAQPRAVEPLIGTRSRGARSTTRLSYPFI
jgi:aspartate aminotransferase-like enzyme